MSEHTLSRSQGMFFGAHMSKITLPEFAVLALLISLHLYGVGVIELYGLSVAAWDCVVVVLVFLWIICQFIGRKPIQIRGAFISLLFMSFLFTAWMGVSAFFSPQLERAFTMFLLQVRNLLLVSLLGILFSNFKDFDFLNKKLLTAGVGIATLGLFMYVTAWFHYPTILAAPELWKPGTGYILDQGGALRLIGLAKDPNFYSTWIALPFFIGFTKRFSMWNLCAVAIIGLSIALAMSRGFAVAFLVSVTLLLLMKVTAGASFRGYVKKLFVGIAAVGMMVIAGYFFFSFDLQQFVKRVELVAETPRWEMWENLFKLFGEEELDLSYKAVSSGWSIWYESTLEIRYMPQFSVVGRGCGYYHHIKNRFYLAWRYLSWRYVFVYFGVRLGKYFYDTVKHSFLIVYPKGIVLGLRVLKNTPRDLLDGKALEYLKLYGGRL